MQKDDRVTYRSPFSGCEFPAIVTAVRDGGFVDLKVNVGAKEPWPLLAVRADSSRIRPHTPNGKNPQGQPPQAEG